MPDATQMPAELWMLWSDYPRIDSDTPIGWVTDSDGLCCFTSLSDAKHVASRYAEEYSLSCIPVKVKGATDGR